MKYLIMTEGKDELILINIFIEKSIFKYKKDQLLYETPFHARQLNDKRAIINAIRQISPKERITNFRVGDKLSDKLTIPSDLKSKIEKVSKICTLPELEILIIINERMLSQFEKVKSKQKASDFCCMHVKGFSKSSTWYEAYFEKLTGVEIVALLKKYKKQRMKSHHKDQFCLTKLIKNNLLQ